MDPQKNSSKRWLQAELLKKLKAKKETKDTTTFFSMEDPETVLLIDKWEDEAALDEHHKSPKMKTIAELRKKHKWSLKIEQFVKKEEK